MERDDLQRYDRQRKVHNGAILDDHWAQASVLLVGVGGVGSPLAQMLHRNGLGKLTLADGDRVQSTDLHRQILYTDEDVQQGLPKVRAAKRALESQGGRCVVETHEGNLTPRNVLDLFRGHDVVIDATDHVAARSLIQKASLQTGIGWIHSAAIADRWVAASFNPPGSPCYHCWVDPRLDQYPLGTCETEGVLPAACFAAASAVLRLLTESLRTGPDNDSPRDQIRRIIRGSLTDGETWVELAEDPSCPTCSDQGKATRIRESESTSGTYPVRRLCGSGSLETWIDVGLDQIEKVLQKSSGTENYSRSPWSLRVEDPAGAIICFEVGVHSSPGISLLTKFGQKKGWHKSSDIEGLCQPAHFRLSGSD